MLEWQLQCFLLENVEDFPSWIADLIVIRQHPNLVSLQHDPTLPWGGDKIGNVLKWADINNAVPIRSQLNLSVRVVVLVLEPEQHQAVSDGLSVLVLNK